jgi:predicted aldo/keto reductase-like oxidoreductase
MVIFPCTAKTKEKGSAPIAANVEEGAMPAAWSSDQSKSIFATLREKKVGLVTIKPFIGGGLFPPLGKQGPAPGAGNPQENELARLTLQCVLSNDAITAVVCGVDTPGQVQNAARASYQRPLGMTPRQRQWLGCVTEQHWRNLPEQYAWLRDWEWV